MRRPSELPALATVSDALQDLSDTVTGAEDDLLASLVVLGEPDAQRGVDAWVDQVVDVLRAVDEVAAQHRATLARAEARQPSAPVATVGDVATARHPERVAPSPTEQR